MWKGCITMRQPKGWGFPGRHLDEYSLRLGVQLPLLFHRGRPFASKVVSLFKLLSVEVADGEGTAAEEDGVVMLVNVIEELKN